jgi:hypothetical protein
MNAIDLMTFGASVTKADGSVHTDTRDGKFDPSARDIPT